MERGETIGLAVSGGAHAALILWVALGDLLFRPPPPRPVEIADVAMISEAEFRALTAVAAAAPRAAPEAPSAPELPDTTAPAPAPSSDTRAALPPQPALPEEAVPDAAPDVLALAPPQAEVRDAPPNPILAPVIEPDEQVLPEISPRPQPRPAPRVAPTPSDAPAPDAAPAPDTLAATRPDEAAEPAEEPAPEREAAAPEEAGTTLPSEAIEDISADEVASSAPLTSLRPRARPTARPVAETAAEAAPEIEDPVDPVADALAEALGETTQAATAGAQGRIGNRISQGEIDDLVRWYERNLCWTKPDPTTLAGRTTVTIAVSMDLRGKAIADSIRLIGPEGPMEPEVRTAYGAARRAILKCNAHEFPLSTDKYDQWKNLEIVFRPNR